jgi:nucleotide-binding universal stress UspA family protein
MALATPAGMFEKQQKRILVPVDFSEGGDRALAEAMSFAKSVGATIEILHVLDLVLQDFPMGLGFYNFDQGGYFAYADLALAERANRVRAAGLVCETHVLEGRPATEIVNRANETGPDLIAIGTHGRTGVAHVILGSVAERVVQRASCPVLTVPFGHHGA